MLKRGEDVEPSNKCFGALILVPLWPAAAGIFAHARAGQSWPALPTFNSTARAGHPFAHARAGQHCQLSTALPELATQLSAALPGVAVP
eukprot:1160736-Pelagomonas_calceolata.AAC.2